MDVIQRIIELMEQHGLTAKQFTKEAGLNASAITEWKKGKSKPSAKSLQKIADYFHVTTDYLLTGKVPKKDPPAADKVAEDDDDIDINDLNFALSGDVHELSDDEVQEIISIAKFVRRERRLRDQKKTSDGEKKDG